VPRESPTFIEQARRQQLVGVTISLLAEHGFAGTSLGRIAAAAGLSKAAVLYHFTTKDAVVSAAYDAVVEELVTAVGEAVAVADPAERPSAYLLTMIGHLVDRPEHAHVMIEALAGQRPPASAAATQPEQRWRPVVELVQGAREARGLPPIDDARTVAIAVGGAIDAVVAEKLLDPAYDTELAVETLDGWLHRVLDR
jgi:AcrR family transcriptional regulator